MHYTLYTCIVLCVVECALLATGFIPLFLMTKGTNDLLRTCTISIFTNRYITFCFFVFPFRSGTVHQFGRIYSKIYCIHRNTRESAEQVLRFYRYDCMMSHVWCVWVWLLAIGCASCSTALQTHYALSNCIFFSCGRI